MVRADAGFFDQQLLGFLEQRGLFYIVVARLTLWLKREAARVTPWRALDEHYAVGEFFLQLYGWDRPRRFVVIREQLRAERNSLGRKLLDVPGYTFRVFVTNLPLPQEEIWRDYNRRADMENRIAELKHDLAADDFCLQDFSPPKQPSVASCCCSTCSENSSAPVVSPRIANRPRCAPKFSFAVPCWAEPATAWSCICPLPGAGYSSASRCWKTS